MLYVHKIEGDNGVGNLLTFKFTVGKKVAAEISCKISLIAGWLAVRIMDKDWMSKNRLSHEYEAGVEYFLQFASRNANNPNAMPCPCAKCGESDVEETRGGDQGAGLD
ncbi:uncharacterized protein LOC142551114 [Primulina tabacum]|uniref:uncharacterized protein LOC142551107 n=1 Tax=Primulina tabacum TaxID=48773 RepID=UPI003F596A9C